MRKKWNKQNDVLKIINNLNVLKNYEYCNQIFFIKFFYIYFYFFIQILFEFKLTQFDCIKYDFKLKFNYYQIILRKKINISTTKQYK